MATMPAQSDVWYAAYGSNLDRARFLCYITGGRPAGAARTYPGCRDTTVPVVESAMRIPHSLYFAGMSTVWGGGVAFVDTISADVPRTYSRLYRITWEQFTDVHSQDNWTGTTDAVVPTPAQMRSERVACVGSGWYDTLLYLGEHDGLPVLTFTAADRAGVGALTPPTDAYVATMARGLVESHGISVAECASYVSAAPGASGSMDPDALAARLA